MKTSALVIFFFQMSKTEKKKKKALKVILIIDLFEWLNVDGLMKRHISGYC